MFLPIIPLYQGSLNPKPSTIGDSGAANKSPGATYFLRSWTWLRLSARIRCSFVAGALQQGLGFWVRKTENQIEKKIDLGVMYPAGSLLASDGVRLLEPEAERFRFKLCSEVTGHA